MLKAASTHFGHCSSRFLKKIKPEGIVTVFVAFPCRVRRCTCSVVRNRLIRVPGAASVDVCFRPASKRFPRIVKSRIHRRTSSEVAAPRNCVSGCSSYVLLWHKITHSCSSVNYRNKSTKHLLMIVAAAFYGKSGFVSQHSSGWLLLPRCGLR